MPPSRVPSHYAQQQQPRPQAQYNIAVGVAEALRNPYTQSPNQFHNAYSVHYANAYMQSQMVAPTTPEGYTLSSTYTPQAECFRPPVRPNGHHPLSSAQSRGQGHKVPPSTTARQPTQHGSWYKQGNSRCTYPKCSFSGSQKSVEIHMIDRHLIYPPNWVKEKKGIDWDADPSLKGKTVPIQGTSVVLNTPETIDVWLAERKKRWPTVQRVQEKKEKIEEAIARGQLPLMSAASRGTKRRREEGQNSQRSNKRHFQNSAQRKKQSEAQTTPFQEPKQCQPAASQPLQDFLPKNSSQPPSSTVDDLDNAEGDSDDEAPEVLSSKQATSHAHSEVQEAGNTLEKLSNTPLTKTPSKLTRPQKKEPKLPPRNPFASRSTLLRNLLRPEIRMTVSNLSQAIRFLVDNDFLRDLEIKPGQVEHNLIEVLQSQPSQPANIPHEPSTPLPQ